jgi:hypothetical protein
MGKVKHPDTLLSYIKSLEKRIAVLETQQRLQAARISSGQLNIGAASAGDQIEINATLSRIRFTSGTDAPTDLNAFGGGGAALQTTGTAGAIPAQTLMWCGDHHHALQVNRVNADGSTTVTGEVYTDIQDSGSGNHRGTVSLTATGSDHDGSFINLSADGGTVLYTNARTTDPPAPAPDTVVLYVKANRLFYRDGGGVVRGPL